jgi:hypothetical protein
LFPSGAGAKSRGEAAAVLGDELLGAIEKPGLSHILGQHARSVLLCGHVLTGCKQLELFVQVVWNIEVQWATVGAGV